MALSRPLALFLLWLASILHCPASGWRRSGRSGKQGSWWGNHKRKSFLDAAAAAVSFHRGGAGNRDVSSSSSFNQTTTTASSSSLLQDSSPLSNPPYRIVQERVLHNQWRMLRSRTVELCPQQHAEFEIVSQGDRGGVVRDQAVLVFVWDRRTRTCVLVREYMPSVHQFMVGLAAGMVEDKHLLDDDNNNDQEKECVEHEPNLEHTSSNDDHHHERMIQTAARHELEEECRLTGGEWHKLCAPTVMDKYTTTRLSVYLVLDAEPVALEQAKPRDDTEQGMTVVHNVTIADLHRYMAHGQMTVVGGWATQLALRKLRDLGELDRA